MLWVDALRFFFVSHAGLFPQTKHMAENRWDVSADGETQLDEKERGISFEQNDTFFTLIRLRPEHTLLCERRKALSHAFGMYILRIIKLRWRCENSIASTDGSTILRISHTHGNTHLGSIPGKTWINRPLALTGHGLGNRTNYVWPNPN